MARKIPKWKRQRKEQRRRSKQKKRMKQSTRRTFQPVKKKTAFFPKAIENIIMNYHMELETAAKYKEYVKELSICQNVWMFNDNFVHRHVLMLLIKMLKKTGKIFTNDYACPRKFYSIIVSLKELWEERVVWDEESVYGSDDEDETKTCTQSRGIHYFDYMFALPELCRRCEHGIPIIEKRKTRCLKELIVYSRAILCNGESDCSMTFRLIEMAKVYRSIDLDVKGYWPKKFHYTINLIDELKSFRTATRPREERINGRTRTVHDTMSTTSTPFHRFICNIGQTH